LYISISPHRLLAVIFAKIIFASKNVQTCFADEVLPVGNRDCDATGDAIKKPACG